MRKVGQMVGPAIGREEVVRASKAFKVLRDWSSIVGEGMASRSCPDRYDHGTVWVAVEGSAWAQELRMQREQILAKLQEKCGDPGLFINLRFGVRPLPPAPVEPLEKPKPRSKPEPTNASIREIAERRLKNWPNGGSPS